jgi:uncharacterized membrane protein
MGTRRRGYAGRVTDLDTSGLDAPGPDASGSGASGRTGSRVLGPGLVLGAGLGGFVDGIALHQILGWHHLLSERPGLSPAGQVTADGLFHAATWVAVLVGVLWLWRRVRAGVAAWSWGRLAGPMLAGWGGFNLVEGLVDHHLLGVHHVRTGPGQIWYDLGFLAFGAVLLAVGWSVHHRSARKKGEAVVTRMP